MKTLAYLLLLVSCASINEAAKNLNTSMGTAPFGASGVAVLGAPDNLPRPLKGWDPAYTTYVQKNATATMLQFPAPSFCPNWYSLSTAEKQDFWAAVLESSSYAETGFNRLDEYYESGISDKDSVTGLQNVSEGLLQLSYGDAACQGVFDFAGDKPGFQDDFAKLQSLNAAKSGQGEITSSHPETSILDPYKNLQCGIKIWTALISSYGNSPSLSSIGGHYWSTARSGSNSDMVSHFKARMPGCF